MLAAATDWLQDHFFPAACAFFIGLTLWETIRPLRAPAAPPGWRWGANVGCFVVNTVLLSSVVTYDRVLAVLGVSGPALDGPVATLGRVAGDWPVLICGILASELFLYAAHRLEHGVAVLWRMHVVHHSDTELDASTGFRHFPGETLLHMLVGTAMFVALGIPAWVGAAYGMLSYVVGVAQHVNLRLLPAATDRALQIVLVTPAMHRVHHSVRVAERDANYGNLLSIWDHLFGTYRAASAAEHAAMAFGVAGLRDAADARPDRVLLQPFRRPAAAGPGTPADAMQPGGD